jgi:class 3 adenylate cyclase
MDRRLEKVVRELERSHWAADVFDADWRLVWVSPGLRDVLGERDEEALGYGQHILAVRSLEPWQRVLSRDLRLELLVRNAAYWLHETPGGPEAVLEFCPKPLRDRLSSVEPKPSPPVWTWELEYAVGDLPTVRIDAVAARLHDDRGRRIGTQTLYGPGLSPRMFTLLVRGDERMFERMARLTEPQQRETAILFADLESSGTLARRLATGSYFRLINAFATTVDEIIIERQGIVGKHVGDGVTAFFLAEDLGSPSRAARAAVDAARSILTLTDLSTEAGDAAAAAGDYSINIGLHWGSTVYMGQVVTGGRLEVTALGDEVNEAARIEQTATGGEILASKALIERLGQEDARDLSIDAEALIYQMIGERDDATEKARRDAGGLPVTSLLE